MPQLGKTSIWNANKKDERGSSSHKSVWNTVKEDEQESSSRKRAWMIKWKPCFYGLVGGMLVACIGLSIVSVLFIKVKYKMPSLRIETTDKIDV